MNALDLWGQLHDKLGALPAKETPPGDLYAALVKNAGEIMEVTSQWGLDVEKLAQGSYLQSKIEEIAFLVVSLYGVAGWTARGKDQPFRADFFV